MEVAYAAKKSHMSTREVLTAMKEAGLGSMCGTAAEILVDAVRKKICAQKVSTDEWVRIIREAHAMGIPTTATIMYGHCESDEDRCITWQSCVKFRMRRTDSQNLFLSRLFT